MYAVFMQHADEIFPKLAKKYHGHKIKLFDTKQLAERWMWSVICRNGFGETLSNGMYRIGTGPELENDAYNTITTAIDEFQSGFGATQYFHCHPVVK